MAAICNLLQGAGQAASITSRSRTNRLSARPVRFPAACKAPPQVFAAALPDHAGLIVSLGHALDTTFAGQLGKLLCVGSRTLGGRFQGGWIKFGKERIEMSLEAMQGGLFACGLLLRAL